MTTLRSVFQRIDRNGDQVVTRDELKKFAEDAGIGGGLLGGKKVSLVVDAFFDAFDGNRDGKVGWDEFVENGRKLLPADVMGNGDLSDAVDLWASKTDRNADQALSVDEIRSELQRILEEKGESFAGMKAEVAGKLTVHVVDENADTRANFSELSSLANDIEKVNSGPKNA